VETVGTALLPRILPTVAGLGDAAGAARTASRSSRSAGAPTAGPTGRESPHASDAPRTPRRWAAVGFVSLAPDPDHAQGPASEERAGRLRSTHPPLLAGMARDRREQSRGRARRGGGPPFGLADAFDGPGGGVAHGRMGMG